MLSGNDQDMLSFVLNFLNVHSRVLQHHCVLMYELLYISWGIFNLVADKMLTEDHLLLFLK